MRTGTEPMTSEWRSLFAYVPQQNALMSGTIREVVTFGMQTKKGEERMEKKVLSNLREMTEKTVLIVTHRKAALEICDMELRFSEGSIREIP